MNNFFEKAFALRQRYYDDTVKLRFELLGPDYATMTTNPCEDFKIEILSQLVATYFMYGENIPDEFSIKLSKFYITDTLTNVLQEIFNDLSTIYKVDSVSRVQSPSIYNHHVGAYAYNVTLAK